MDLVLAHTAFAKLYRDLGPFLFGVGLQLFEVGGLDDMHFGLSTFYKFSMGLRSGN